MLEKAKDWLSFYNILFFQETIQALNALSFENNFHLGE